MRVEVEKTHRAHEIGRRCGLFRVPEVLEYDAAKGIAVFERLDIRPVSTGARWGKQRESIAHCLGTSLAIVHRELILPFDMKVPLPNEFALSGDDDVFLHGDVTVDNVCIGSSWPPIVILDWQMTPNYGSQATCGTRLFDLFWFISSLIKRPFTRFLFFDPVRPVATAFFESYFREAKCAYDPKKVIRYATQFFDLEIPRIQRYIRQNSWGRARFLFPYGCAILEGFVDSLDTLELDIRRSAIRGEECQGKDG